jgi:hypothetical protein
MKRTLYYALLVLFVLVMLALAFMWICDRVSYNEDMWQRANAPVEQKI